MRPPSPVCPSDSKKKGWILDKKTCSCSRKLKSKSVSVKKSVKKKLPRCPRGYRRDKDTKLCIPNKDIHHTIKIKSKVPKAITKKKRKIKLVIQNTTPPDDIAVSKAVSSLIDDGIIVPQLKIPTLQDRLKIIPEIRSELIRQKSYSPSVNKRLVSMKEGDYSSIFGCGVEDILKKRTSTTLPKIQVKIGTDKKGKPICVSWTTKKAQKILLDNLKQSIKIDCRKVIAPMQSRSNCWFNTMFVTFFISDKGRKFFRYFRQLMIEGKHADGVTIKPRKLAQAFFLFNAAIEASQNPPGIEGEPDLATLMDTNNLIDAIYSGLPVAARKRYRAIKSSGISNNPLAYYMDIVEYLKSISKHSPDLAIHKISSPHLFKKILKYGWSHSTFPDIIVVTVHDDNSKTDFAGSKPGESGEYKDKPLSFHLSLSSQKAKYTLDSAVIRDTEAQHFCSVLTCDDEEMGFDGESFSRMSKFTWKSLINTSKDWSFEGSVWKGTKDPINWNFRNGYQLLFYYRTA